MDKHFLQEGLIRLSNPFSDMLMSELIENVKLYQDMFSYNILSGQACSVFRPGNVVVIGPQGSGKTMLLNLTRLWVLANWSQNKRPWPGIIEQVPPFFGISINLTRASFHTFGKRSVSKALDKDPDINLEVAAAADYITHYLFREFLRGIRLLKEYECNEVIEWMGIKKEYIESEKTARKIAKWDCWFGYYQDCTSWSDLIRKCAGRINYWTSFLNANTDSIENEIWSTKADPVIALNQIGRLVTNLCSKDERLSLIVYIDQYEVLKELNEKYCGMLQRLINSLIKARDPYVFYRIGARTYDWGQELRVSGAESKIELHRDYTVVNLHDVLMRRTEDRIGYIFPKFAEDVACRRIEIIEGSKCNADKFRSIFKKWRSFDEVKLYYKDKAKIDLGAVTLISHARPLILLVKSIGWE